MATHILLVEPNAASAHELTEIASDFPDWVVSFVPSGPEALALLEAGVQPQLVLLAWDGGATQVASLVSTLRERQAELPIALLTPEGMDFTGDLASQVGVQSVLSKPFDSSRLSDVLSEAHSQPFRSPLPVTGKLAPVDRPNGDPIVLESSASPPPEPATTAIADYLDGGHIALTDEQVQQLVSTLNEAVSQTGEAALVLSQDGALLTHTEPVSAEAANALARLTGRIWRAESPSPTREALRFIDEWPGDGDAPDYTAIHSVIVRGDVALSAAWDGSSPLTALRTSTAVVVDWLDVALQEMLPEVEVREPPVSEPQIEVEAPSIDDTPDEKDEPQPSDVPADEQADLETSEAPLGPEFGEWLDDRLIDDPDFVPEREAREPSLLRRLSAPGGVEELLDAPDEPDEADAPQQTLAGLEDLDPNWLEDFRQLAESSEVLSPEADSLDAPALEAGETLPAAEPFILPDDEGEPAVAEDIIAWDWVDGEPAAESGEEAATEKAQPEEAEEEPAEPAELAEAEQSPAIEIDWPVEALDSLIGEDSPPADRLEDAVEDVPEPELLSEAPPPVEAVEELPEAEPPSEAPEPAPVAEADDKPAPRAPDVAPQAPKREPAVQRSRSVRQPAPQAAPREAEQTGPSVRRRVAELARQRRALQTAQATASAAVGSASSGAATARRLPISLPAPARVALGVIAAFLIGLLILNSSGGPRPARLRETYRADPLGVSVMTPESWIGDTTPAYSVLLSGAQSAVVAENPDTITALEIGIYERSLALDAPVFWAVVYPQEPDSEASLEELLDTFMGTLPISDLESEPSLIIRVDRRRAAQVAFSGTDPATGQALEGRITLVRWFGQVGVMIGVAPMEEWRAFAATYETMVESVDLYNPPGVRVIE